MTAPSARVLLVDDVPEVRTLLRAAISLRDDLEVVGEASRGVAGVTLVAELEPDIVVLDLGLPDLAGRDVLTQILAQRPTTEVVIFSGVDPEDRTWYEERAAGYVLKDADITYLVDLLGSLASSPDDTETVTVASMSLPADLEGVRDARRFAVRTLASWGVEEVIDEASVVVTELASNSVLHANSGYELRLTLGAHAVRVEVTDHGPGTPEPQVFSEGGESGRGLLMVAALSVSWGVERGAGGKTVWAELARHNGNGMTAAG